MAEEKEQSREQRNLSEDVVPDAFPANFERYDEPLPGTPPTVECSHHCMLPSVACNHQLKVKCWQRQPDLRAAFIWDKHYAKLLFDESDGELRRQNCLVYGSLEEALRASYSAWKELGRNLQLILYADKQCVRLLIFSSAKQDLLVKQHTVTESLQTTSLLSPLCRALTALH